MIYRQINRKNWSCDIYVAIDNYWVGEIIGKLQELDASRVVILRIRKNILSGNLNSGFTFSNPQKRKSVLMVGKSSSGHQFINTLFHEVRHLVDDIAKADNMNLSGEGVAYLTGDIAMDLTDLVAYYLQHATYQSQ